MAEVLHSIMFYGGRLLSHLSAEDPEVLDFISLRRLNRNICILIDSDKHSHEDSLNATKMRVIEEFKSAPGFAWVTDGCCVENYVPHDVLAAAVTDIHKTATGLRVATKYADPLSMIEGFDGEPDKVRISRKVVETRADLNVLDLHTRIDDIVRFVKASNGPDAM